VNLGFFQNMPRFGSGKEKSLKKLLIAFFCGFHKINDI